MSVIWLEILSRSAGTMERAGVLHKPHLSVRLSSAGFTIKAVMSGLWTLEQSEQNKRTLNLYHSILWTASTDAERKAVISSSSPGLHHVAPGGTD